MFKDGPTEQTKTRVRDKVEKALPGKRKQLGDWNHDFDAAKAAVSEVQRSQIVATENAHEPERLCLHG